MVRQEIETLLTERRQDLEDLQYEIRRYRRDIEDGDDDPGLVRTLSRMECEEDDLNQTIKSLEDDLSTLTQCE